MKREFAIVYESLNDLLVNVNAGDPENPRDSETAITVRFARTAILSFQWNLIVHFDALRDVPIVCCSRNI